jgi:hypothetical protein
MKRGFATLHLLSPLSGRKFCRKPWDTFPKPA